MASNPDYDFFEKYGYLPNKSYQETNSSDKVKFAPFIIALVVFIIIVVSIALSQSSDSAPVSSAPVNSTSSALNPIPISNGEMLLYPGYECVCPLSVAVSGDNGYYVYLKYQYAPSDSLVSRQATNGYESDLAFYVAPNSTVEINVPIGVYKLYYACGPVWHGTLAKFGDDTMYYSSDDLLKFYADESYFNGVTLELWAQYDGNFDTDVVDKSEFPA